ncbi:MAG: hypothetical protein R3284_08890 [Rubricoccaceae bacterium]|nr:hypothetical protein [Rubricoccaceae bacterium]
MLKRFGCVSLGLLVLSQSGDRPFAFSVGGEGRLFYRHGRLAVAHLRSGEFERAIEHLEKQYFIAPENPDPLYYLACAHALTGDTETALTWLEQAIENGYVNSKIAREDNSLESLRQAERFKGLIARMEENSLRLSEEFSHAHERLPVSSTRSFKSLRRLEKHFIDQEAALNREA